ncbi:MAG: phage antirepressor [Firmicutes bacterium]|nr:phage antirepressor [Bacillota bacterium]
MENLQVIEQRDVFGKDFKIYGTPEEPLFLTKDVAAWIEYEKSSVHKLVAMVDEDEKVRKNVPTPGGAQETWFLTEDGLYEVLMQSRKPIAKKFKKKVKEILKDIRKHGMFVADKLLDEMLHNPDLGIKMFTEYKAAKERAKQMELENAQNKQIIGELKPKASYYDMILQNKSLVPISKIAKDYGMSGIAMNKLLHQLGVQYKMGNTWLLYQEYADMGYTQSKTHAIDAERSVMHTYWTQKGRLFLYDLLKNEKGLLPVIERANKSA